MPTVKNIPGSYRFFFFSNEGIEPPHVHVRRDSHTCKFWLEPVKLADNEGFAKHELARIEELAVIYKARIMEAWHEHFD